MITFQVGQKKFQIPVLVILLFVLILGSLFRLYKLDFQSLWLDEIYSVNGAGPQKQLKEVIEYSKTDQPPLYFIILHIWFKIFSFNDYNARLLSVLFGTLGIISMFFLGKEFKDEKVGLIASALTAFNFFSIMYSQEARFYSLLFLLSALSFLFFKRALRTERPIDLSLYTLTTSLIIYTHYFGFVLYFSQVIIFFALLVKGQFNWKFAVNAFVFGLATILLCSPWIPVYLSDISGHSSFWIAPPKLYFLFSFFYRYFKDPVSTSIFFCITIYFIYFVVIQYKKNSSIDMSNLLILAWISLCTLIPLLYSIVKVPILIPRYSIIVLPSYLLMISIGFFEIKSTWLRFFLGFVTFFSSVSYLLFFSGYYSEVQKQEWKQVACEVIKQNKQNQVIFSYYADHFNYYFESLGYNGRATHPRKVNYQEALKGKKWVWLIQGHDAGFSATNEEIGLIERTFAVELEKEYYLARCRLYRAKEDTN